MSEFLIGLGTVLMFFCAPVLFVLALIWDFRYLALLVLLALAWVRI